MMGLTRHCSTGCFNQVASCLKLGLENCIRERHEAPQRGILAIILIGFRTFPRAGSVTVPEGRGVDSSRK